jgi:hypothetical protein
MAAIKKSEQTITLCGDNAHFQNAVAERRIRTLQDQARTMLICSCSTQVAQGYGAMLIYGLLLSVGPMKFTTLHLQLEEKTTSLPTSYL